VEFREKRRDERSFLMLAVTDYRTLWLGFLKNSDAKMAHSFRTANLPLT